MAASDRMALPEKDALAPSPNLQCHHLISEPPSRQLPESSAFGNASSTATHSSRRDSERQRSDSDRTKVSFLSKVSEASESRGSRPAVHGAVRSLPSWIDSVETYNEEDDSKVTDRLLAQPTPSVAPQHPYATTRADRPVSKDGFIDHDEVTEAAKSARERTLFGTTREPVRGRKWDHARDDDPVILQYHGGNAQLWSGFVKASMYGPGMGEESETVEPTFLDEQTPGYAQPWRGDAPGSDPEKALGLLRSKKKRLQWYERAQRIILMHPLVPLAFRLTVLATSTIALGLSSSIFHLTRSSPFAQSPSGIMAIVVDVIALPYIGYITWDEYTGAPLGLREPKTKMRLVLLDLFFIIFESANLSLAFQAITDNDGACFMKTGDETAHNIDPNLCGQVKALAAILFVALVAWGLTFTVSILRLVQRVGGREETD
ncbi:hypothetical protein V500_02338 [Pseudogymnoascus sp. VKM F-4518 (FW-2643)]|nr:hypothetical protein V500_02338 [Pseudogymnoascus sp. VKM F-4518 (FW-2643)]